MVLWQTLKAKSDFFPLPVYQQLGQRIMRLGEPILAYDVVGEGLKLWGRDLRLRQLKALALLRSGAIQGAVDLLTRLQKEGHRDEETVGLLARAEKDLASQADEPGEKERLWRRAYRSYAAAYKETGGYWTGINAATISRLLGEVKKARALAKEVYQRCLEELPQVAGAGGDPYWLQATLAEAALIQEDLNKSRHWYLQAAEAAQGRYGDLGTTLRNARLLMGIIGLNAEEQRRLESCFRLPVVVVFAGHMIDQPGRRQPRFPAALEPRVSRKIKALLERLDARIGYSSAACGADILFQEAMQRQGGEANIVLPFKQDAFKQTSVAIIPGSAWGRRFDKVLKRATRVVLASDNAASANEVVYEYANLLQYGLARLRAAMLNTRVVPMVVWDGKPGDGPAGTFSQVRYWRDHGLEPEIINVTDLLPAMEVGGANPAVAQPLPTPPAVPAAPAIVYPQQIKGILFADVVGFSRLLEEQIPAFVDAFMGEIYHLLQEFPSQPLLTNTWGDALYCIFDSVREVGLFSLELRDRLVKMDWRQFALPGDLSIRISLHAGPIFHCQKALFAGLKYAGSHVNRGARIEPITPPGQVYASQHFAALATSQHLRDFICDYVGQIPLPKKSGIVPLYLVRRPN
jgi:class 3 adenylate cyclase